MRVFQECISSVGWQEVEVPSSDPAKPPYLITIPPWDRGNPDEISCSCPGYEFRGYCRHQREAWQYVCNWSEIDSALQQTEEQRKKRICPECEGKTHIVVEED